MIGLWNEKGVVVHEYRPQKDRELPLLWLNLRIREASGVPDALFPEALIPQTGLTAWIKNDAGREILAGAAFCYFEKTSPVAVAGFLVTYPGNTPQQSADVTASLLAEMPEYARKAGAKHLLTTFGNDGINKILDRIGFVTGDTGVQHKYLFL